MINKNEIPEIFKSPYDGSQHEDIIYKMWEESGLFNPDVCIEKGFTDPEAKPFSIVLPPPNVTGTLHVGHSAMLAIEDTLVRYHRMKGAQTLWIPGTDHAGIATQSKVEKILSKEKIRKHDLGREEFLNKVDTFVKDSQSTILNQLRKMGSSLDWSRYAFTLDESREKAVKTTFKKMYDDGLIYQKDRVVNWDPKGQTTISDEEVDHEEVEAVMYTFKYSKDFPIPIATTRPETKVGDVAVAVNPEDERYQEYIGQTFDVTFCEVDLSIKIIADKAVDPEFGTGAVGVTPAHSQIDYDIGTRHDLPLIQVINEYAKMNGKAGPLLEGLRTSDARTKVVEWLEENDLIIEKEDVKQNLSKAERTGGVIEPLPKLQWWISVTKEFTIPHSNIKGIESGSKTTLQKLMLAAVEEKQVDIIPDRYEKVYLHWVNNLRDWCISRQIWYGHQIPVWYKGDEIYTGTEAPEGEGWTQDEDTLDTWFSSGLWTFSTLGWPEETSDMKRFHPTNVLETGHDILPFWVMRMILMSTYLLGEIPFDTVYLHGMVQNKQGKKMSKSSGDAIDPLDISEKFGADALRLSLIIGNGPGSDIKVSEEKIRAYRKFSNKIWNASRFVLENANQEYFNENNIPALTDQNQKEIRDLNEIVEDVTKDIEEYRFYIAGEKLYHYFWHNFADIIIEENKEILNSKESSDEDKASSSYTLYKILTTSLKMLHPFMPFITETIWQNLPNKESEILMVSKWPLNK